MTRGRMLRAMGWVMLLPVLACAIACQDSAASEVETLLRPDPWRVLHKLPLCTHEEGWELLVRDESGTPVQADVIVYLPAKPTQPVLDSVRAYGSHSYVALAARSGGHAKRYRTDKDGVVRIAKGATVHCFGITDDSLSTAVAAGGVTVLSMRPHRRVMLEAVDKDGRPAGGLPIAIFDDVSKQDVANSVTDAIGRCTTYVPWHSDKGEPALSVRPLVVARTPPIVAIANDYFEGKPRMLRIELPPVGSVLVQMTKHVKVRGQHSSASLFALAESGQPTSGSRWYSRAIVDGEALVPFVALGERVQAHVQAEHHYAQIAAGPTKPGEVVTIKVGREPVTVVGQLLDKEGKQIANHHAFAEVAATRAMWPWEFLTDQEGRFAVDLLIDHIPVGTVRVQIDMTAATARAGLGGVPGGHSSDSVNSRAARAARVVEWPGSGRVDLGILTVQVAPEILAGKVIDPAGDPVAGVTVEAKTGWAIPSIYRAISAADGSFAFYAEDDGAPARENLQLKVEAKHWRHIGEIEAAIGDAVEVQVKPICSVELRLEDESLADTLRAYIIDSNGRRHGGYPRAGLCRFRGVAPGKYTLELQLVGRVVKRVEDIEVMHGKPNIPFGEVEVEWLDGVRVITLEVKAPDGTALDAKGSMLAEKRRSAIVSSFTIGELRLPYLDGQKLFVQVDGHRSQRVKPKGETMKVVMHPRADLRIRAPKGLALPRDTKVRFDDSPEVHPLRLAGASRVRPDASGETYMTLVVPDGRGSFEEVHSEPVRIPDSAEPVELELRVSAEVVTKAHRVAAAGRAKLAARMRR